MRFSGWCAVALALGLAPAAWAQDSQPQPDPNNPPPAPIDLITPEQKPPPPPTAAETSAGGFETGLDLQALVPLGDTFQGTSLKSMVSGQAALQLDLGWRIDPAWEVGAFFGYGLAFVNGCTQNVSCTSHDVRLGLQGQWHLSPRARFDPWLGLGVGYEFMTLSSSGAPDPTTGQSVETSVTYQGLTLASLKVGADWAVSEDFGGGPYVGLDVGRFTTTSESDLTNKSTHLWLGLGLRAWFDVH